MITLIPELLDSEDVNLILVDWSVFAGQSYSNAVSAVPSIGRDIAAYLSTLSLSGVTPATIHLVGFNLGAHIAGWVGRSITDTVARITGESPVRINAM